MKAWDIYWWSLLHAEKQCQLSLKLVDISVRFVRYIEGYRALDIEFEVYLPWRIVVNIPSATYSQYYSQFSSSSSGDREPSIDDIPF